MGGRRAALYSTLSGHLSGFQPFPKSVMAPKMKAAMKSGAMTKGALADAIATACEIKKAVANKALATLAEVGTAEVKKSGVFTIPGLCRIKTRKKPAKTVVKAFAVAALKKEF